MSAAAAARACGRAGRSRAAKLGGTAARAPRAARGHEGHVRAGAHPVARDLRGQGAADPEPPMNENVLPLLRAEGGQLTRNERG